MSATDAESGRPAQRQAVRLRGVAVARQLAGLVRDPVRTTTALHRRHGNCVSLEHPAGRVRALVVADPDLNEAILTDTVGTRPASLWAIAGPEGSAHATMRRNYLVATGDYHAQLAKATVPSLNWRSVTGYFGSMTALAAEQVERWPVGQPVDLYALVRGVGREVAFRLLFGEPDPARSKMLVEKLERYLALSWSLGALMFPVNMPGSPYRTLLRMAEDVSNELGRWVEERAEAGGVGDLRAAHAVLTGWDGSRLGPATHAANFSFLAFASFETMSSALTWALYLLALHPGVLSDLADELDAAGGITGLSREQLNGLPLLDAVVKESLRLVPPTPVLVWRTQGRRWELGGMPMTDQGRHVVLFISVQVTHRQPDIYAEPDCFRPKRWASIRPSQFAYLPFSAGPRRCPGAAFGADFIKVGLAAIVPRYRLAIRDGARIDYVFRGITMPKTGPLVTLTKQDRTRRVPQVKGGLTRLVTVT